MTATDLAIPDHFDAAAAWDLLAEHTAAIRRLTVLTEWQTETLGAIQWCIEDSEATMISLREAFGMLGLVAAKGRASGCQGEDVDRSGSSLSPDWKPPPGT